MSAPAKQLPIPILRLMRLQKSRGQPANAFKTAAEALRILKDIKIDRIAAVDKPAQEHALARIIKNANPPAKETEMNVAELEKLEAQIDSVLRKVDAQLGKVRHTVTVDSDYGDDDTVDDHWSSAAEDGDDDEDHEEDLEKASNTFLINRNDSGNRPGSLPSSTHPPNRHKFEALVDKIKNEEGVPKSYAMALARKRYPDVFASYQDRTQSNYSKAAPTTYEELVEAEMRKGCNVEVAGQRVMQLYGSAALRHRTFAKSEVIADRFEKVAEDAWLADEDCDHCTALRKARLSNPRLFRALQAR
jgi:hypothetical protein